MATSEYRTRLLLERARNEASTPEELLQRLTQGPATHTPVQQASSLVTPTALDRRWQGLPPHAQGSRPVLSGANGFPPPETYRRNMENYIGQVTMPVGVAGPLRINGIFARGDFFVPLATTEAALVASCHRGALAITDSGGCATLIQAEGVARSPGFVFATIADAGRFTVWLMGQHEAVRAAAEATSRHARLQEMDFSVEGNHVYVVLDFYTGDASGQNMATIATQAAVDWIVANSPIEPRRWYVEANLSGDKKASAQSFVGVRGRKIGAEVIIPPEVLASRLQTTADAMADYWTLSAMGSVLSGNIGIQGHYANPLAALYLATGQDVACVAESAVGITHFERNGNGALRACVTLPNIMVGTVGGGTALPSQRACLDILGLAGEGKARALAEVAAAITLAAEISIIAALSAGHFTRAHAKRARGNAPARAHDATAPGPDGAQPSAPGQAPEPPSL